MASLRVRQILLEVTSDASSGQGAVAGTSAGITGNVWDRLCATAAAAIPVTGAGVALMTPEGHGGTLATSDGPAAALEDLQETLGEGPCLDAYRGRRPVLEPDLARTGMGRWPVFGPAAAEAGVTAVFAFPLQIGAIRLGVLDLYRATPGPLDSLQLGEALDFAAAAAALLVDLQHDVAPGRLHPDLNEATGSRREIHQATGMVSVQAAVGIADALLLLRAHAYAAERPLLDVAKDVMARVVSFYPENDDQE